MKCAICQQNDSEKSGGMINLQPYQPGVPTPALYLCFECYKARINPHAQRTDLNQKDDTDDRS